MTITAVSAMNWVLAACAVVLMIAAGFTLFRLERGPSILDRVVAFDVLTSVMIGSLSLLAAFAGRIELIPVIAVLAMVGFVGSVAVARFVAAERPDDTKILTKAKIDQILMGATSGKAQGSSPAQRLDAPDGAAPHKAGATASTTTADAASGTATPAGTTSASGTSAGHTAGADTAAAGATGTAAAPAAAGTDQGGQAGVGRDNTHQEMDHTAGPDHIEKAGPPLDPEQYKEDQILRTEAEIDEELADEVVEGEIVDGPMYPGVVYREQGVGEDE